VEVAAADHAEHGVRAQPGQGNQPAACTGPLQYIGQAAVQQDIANLKAALVGQSAEGYLPAIAPGTIEHWLQNEYYKTDEEFLLAVADAMQKAAPAGSRGIVTRVTPHGMESW
jgi:5-methyltetrahydropteroyltriglutamate--homocysteine methyltransferase